jgi:hypothetical protein
MGGIICSAGATRLVGAVILDARINFRDRGARQTQSFSLLPTVDLVVDDHLLEEVPERFVNLLSCGARLAFKLKERSYLRIMLSRRQLQGFVMPTRDHSRYHRDYFPPAESGTRKTR